MRVDRTCVERTTMTMMYYRQGTCMSISQFLLYLDSGTCSILSPKTVIVLEGRTIIVIQTQIDRTTSHLPKYIFFASISFIIYLLYLSEKNPMSPTSYR